MLSQSAAAEMAVCNLGPWPLYQPLFHELDLPSLFDQHLPRDPQQEYSHGQVLQLLLHARLNHPLALMNVAQWAEESGVAALQGIPADKLNDDRLGRALDAFFDHRHSLLAHVTTATLKWADLQLTRLHFDPTHLTFTGSYDSSTPRPALSPREATPQDAALPPAHLGHGYLSRRRMINIGVAAFVDDINFVPVFVHPLDGNRNGQTAMREQYDLMKRLLPLPEGLLMTSDRGTFSAEHVARLHRDGRHVLCAVPWNDYQKLYDQRAESLPWKQASYLSQEQQRRRACQSSLVKDHYELAVIDHDVIDPQPTAGKKQPIAARVIFVKSTAGRREAGQRREKNIATVKAGLQKLNEKLLRGHPQCTPVKIHQQVAALMGKRAVKSFFTYEMVPLTPEEQAALPQPKSGHQRAKHRLVWSFDEAAATADARYDGLAALVTTAPQTTSGDALFTIYKQQAYIERSHHEYKTPLAVAPVFLKSPRRVEALVCLLMLALQFRQVVERRYRLRHAEDQEQSERRMTAEVLERAFRTCPIITWTEAGRYVMTPSQVNPRQRDILVSLRFPSLHRQLLPHRPSG